MRIQHNIMAMSAYRNYNTNTSALSKNLEKLSSGYKINRAGDDAAGLAISEKMRAQITGLSAAQKNVKDGISLVKTAEGAMQEIQDMLNRMDYLATQSANGTYDNEVDRANLQKEVDALKSEINRIADSANFNGIKLLDGSLEKGAIGGVTYEEVASEDIEKMIPETVGHGQPTVDVENTVLESNTNGGDKASFEIRMDGLTSTDKDTKGTLTLKLGDTALNAIQIDGKASSKALAEAVAEANPTVTINGSEYKITAKDGTLTFTGDADSDVVEIAQSKVTFEFKAGEYSGPASFTTGKYTAGTGTNGDAVMALTIKDATGGTLASVSVNNLNEEATAEDIATALTDALADANIEGVSVKANDDGTFAIDVTNEEYVDAGIVSVDMAYTQGTGANGGIDAGAVDNNRAFDSKSWTAKVAFVADSGTITAEGTAASMTLTVGGKSITADGLTHKATATDIAKALQEKIDADDALKGKVTVTEDSAKFTVTVTDADLAKFGEPEFNFTTDTGTGNTAGGFGAGTAKGVMDSSATEVKYNEGTVNLGSYTKGKVTGGAAQVEITLKDADGKTVGTAITASNLNGSDDLDTVVAALNAAGTGVTFSNDNGSLKMTINDKDTYGAAVTADIAYTADTNETVDGAGFAAREGLAIDRGPDLTGSINGGVQNVKAPASPAGNELANTTIDLSEYFTDGTKITLGDTTYTIAVGKDSKFKDAKNVVDLTDMEDDTLDAAEAARRLSEAAEGNNGVFSVGQNDAGKTTLQQLQSAKNSTDMTTIDKLASYIKISKADPASVENAVAGRGLTLQIGDTSDSFNQMEVSVGDMHTTGMGIDGINIGTQEGAAAAIQTIKDAINYVSGIRGDLGAVQNRLEHTGNNLSIMAENIQDAESTIRDTDVAEEMMSYVKNNILVQSAQAMLAQANQVPQGVLQLLG